LRNKNRMQKRMHKEARPKLTQGRVSNDYSTARLFLDQHPGCSAACLVMEPKIAHREAIRFP
jgi:hypothetical protein